MEHPPIPIVSIDAAGLRRLVDRGLSLQGEINGTPGERRFCRLARLLPQTKWSPQDVLPFGDGPFCPELSEGQCGLTCHRSPCLLLAPEDPLWERIRADVAYERG